MTRWQVFRVSFPNGHRQWCAMTRTDYWSDRYFDTFTEAIAYADQRARTVEVVVPRIPKRGCDSRVELTNDGDIKTVTLSSAYERITTTTTPIQPEHLVDHCALILAFAKLTQAAINESEKGE